MVKGNTKSSSKRHSKPKKTSQNKTYSVEEKNKIVNKEIKTEREHPEKIIRDTIKADENIEDSSENLVSQKVEKNSAKFMLWTAAIILLIIAFLFVVPKIASNLTTDDTQYMYNGFYFRYTEGRDAWSIEYMVDDHIFPMDFVNDPRSVEDIPAAFDKNQLTENKALYLVIDPVDGQSASRQMGIAAIEVVTKVGNFFGIPTKSALSKIPADVSPENYNPEQMPIISCLNATKDIGVVVFKIDEFSRVYQEPGTNCYYVTGPTGDDIIRSADRMVYKIIGIIKE